ncbi:MmcQ/YjbR family DNA-binding protein [Catalinimonas niigatensis]|uniref:MmcQ/YjbR family DNA-binding protein n=1 Tax=Catalinimonas niigatensis TaxID=1397264 RepID=UPI0026669210|nr:MmcQ/YjbR family DNA-binding protein [Catalinimonas niigatensis]WPP50905.1 MmcQ/YjbR family DNA-binding protein [Catalinimonas niigatensis]
MDIESFRLYCIAKKGVTEEFPFGEQTLVFKVMGKIFALTNIDTFESVNLKCDPEQAVLLREQYAEVQPGYHMNKKHWNTVNLNGSVGDKLLKEWIDHSYSLVFNSLPAKLKREFDNLF